MHRKYGRKYRHGRGAAAVAALLAAAAAVFLFFEYGVRPYVYDGLSSNVKSLATLEISKTVQELLGERDTEYSDIAKLNTDSEGNITAVTVSALAVNEIKDGISQKLNEAALDKTYYEYKVVLGNLTKSVLLSGRGPHIKIKSIFNGFTVSDIESVFDSAGINQTRHSLYIVINANVGTQILMYEAEEQISTRVLIAETVIVGKVPASYFRDS